MDLGAFAEFHRPALERDEVRHNLILGFLHRFGEIELPELRLWTLGAPGECILQTTPRRVRSSWASSLRRRAPPSLT
jgi:hypothetical protein